MAAGHLLPSSTPHSPESKGRQSAPDSPANGVSAAVLPKAAPSKHSNTAAVAYYRHATQRQQHQQQRAGAVQDTEAGDLVTGNGLSPALVDEKAAESGNPAKAVAEEIEKGRYAAVGMGRSGTGGGTLKRLFSGSVGERLFKDLTGTVLWTCR